MHECYLKCFGVGDGWPSARNHSSYLYRLGRTNVLIDCGEPISRTLYQSGFGFESLDSIVLSHLHFDHVGGFFMLMQSLWLSGRTKPLTVHLPADGIAPIRQMLDAACIFDELLTFRLSFEPLVTGRRVSIGEMTVTPYPTGHLDSFRQRFGGKYTQQFAAYCFLVEGLGRRIGHSADIGAPEDLAPLLVEPLDLLVCELAHLNPESLFCYLKGRPIRRLNFVHLSLRQLEDVESLRALATREIPGTEIEFSCDGAETPL